MVKSYAYQELSATELVYQIEHLWLFELILRLCVRGKTKF